MAPWRIGIVGASSLLGKELGAALRERRFPASAPRLLQSPTAIEGAEAPAQEVRGLVAFDDEAAVLEPFRPDQLEDLDVLFLAGSPADSRQAWAAMASSSRCLVVDLASGLEGEPEAAVSGLDPLAEGWSTDGRLVVVAHPAAQALAHLLGLLARAGRLEAACATVFEPASERGLGGIQELEQQTVRMLALQALPQSVYDAQIAFNLRASLGEEARPSLDDIRQRIARQLDALLDEVTPPPALELLQAPLFHASVVSLFVRYAAAATPAAVEASLASPWVSRYPAGGSYPDVVAAAGEDAMQLGPPRADAADGYWLFATLDNLRRTAFSAVDAATAVLERRRRP